MKKLLLTTLLCWFAMATMATDLKVTLSDFTVTPSTNRTVYVSILTVPTASSTSTIIGSRITYVTDTNGVFYISNVVQNALYSMSVQAPPSRTDFTVQILDTDSGLINAHSNMVAFSTSTFPAGSVAWSAISSDLRYLRAGTPATNVVWPVAGNNITMTTNGLAVTVNSTGSGGGSGTFNGNQFDNNASVTNLKSGLIVTNLVSQGTTRIAAGIVTNAGITTALVNLGLDVLGNIVTNAVPVGSSATFNANQFGTGGGTNILSGSLQSNNTFWATSGNVTVKSSGGQTTALFSPLGGAFFPVGAFSGELVASNGVGTATIDATGVDGNIVASNFISRVNGKHIGDGSGLTNLIWDTHAIFISPTGNDSTFVRGDPVHPAKTFYDYNGATVSGVCSIATNGDTIYVLPGTNSAPFLPLNVGVTLQGIGYPTILMTNRISSTNNVMPGGYETVWLVPRDNVTIRDLALVITNTAFSQARHALIQNMNPAPNTQGGGTPNDVNANNVITYVSATPPNPFLFVDPYGNVTNYYGTNVLFERCSLIGQVDVFYPAAPISSNIVYRTGSTNDPFWDGIDSFWAAMSWSYTTQFLGYASWTVKDSYIWSLWDHLYFSGNGLTVSTINNRAISTGVGVGNFSHGFQLTAGATVYDTGSRIHVWDNSSPSSTYGVSSSSSGRMFMNGTVFYLTNGAIIEASSTSANIYGNWVDGSSNTFQLANSAFIGAKVSDATNALRVDWTNGPALEVSKTNGWATVPITLNAGNVTAGTITNRASAGNKVQVADANKKITDTTATSASAVAGDGTPILIGGGLLLSGGTLTATGPGGSIGWATNGNNLTGGEVLGSLTQFPLRFVAFSNEVAVFDTNSTIRIGRGNVIQTNAANDSSIYGGFTNSILGASTESTIIGGHGNQIGTAAAGAIQSGIFGGFSNVIQGASFESAIVGGHGNVIGTVGQATSDAYIFGGTNNIVQGVSYGSAIIGGMGNVIGAPTIPAIQSVILGGVTSTNYGTDSLIWGYGNTIGTGGPGFVGGHGNALCDAAGGVSSFIGSGTGNYIGTNVTVSGIMGGQFNNISNGVGAAVISGGYQNSVSGSSYGVIPGGFQNRVNGLFGMAAGNRAKAMSQGSFVWGDSISADQADTGIDSFTIRASGGFYLTNSAKGYLQAWGNSIQSSNTTAARAAVLFQTNSSINSLGYAGTNWPGNGHGTDISNGAIGGTNLWQWDALLFPMTFGIGTNGNTYASNTMFASVMNAGTMVAMGGTSTFTNLVVGTNSLVQVTNAFEVYDTNGTLQVSVCDTNGILSARSGGIFGGTGASIFNGGITNNLGLTNTGPVIMQNVTNFAAYLVTGGEAVTTNSLLNNTTVNFTNNWQLFITNNIPNILGFTGKDGAGKTVNSTLLVISNSAGAGSAFQTNCAFPANTRVIGSLTMTNWKEWFIEFIPPNGPTNAWDLGGW